MTKHTHSPRTFAGILLVGASSLAIATPAEANEFLFTAQQAPLRTGERITQTEELTQIRLAGGGIASFTDQAQYQINNDGSIELYEGSVTVAGDEDGPVIVRMPGGLRGSVRGKGSSANFSVAPDGKATGHAITGTVRVGLQNRLRNFPEGAIWAAEPRRGPRRVMANEPQAAPDAPAMSQPAVVAIGGDAGPVAAAENGIPVTLGDALAGAGASSDILAAARRVEAAAGNPALQTFPTGDFAALIARAAEIESIYGGSPFPQAQADIIRAYLRFLASGGTGAQFLSSFSASSLEFLDLIRAGGLPSSFAGGSAVDVDAYLAFISRTGALADLARRDRILAQAYLTFLRNGGNRDGFATSFTDLTNAYFAFVRAGGDPAQFEGASSATIAETIAFLSNSGLADQLSAADRALVTAFLENGGLEFASQFDSTLDTYFAFLESGRRPSEFGDLDQAALRSILETLSDTGLLQTVADERAQFYADYLAFLRAGGDLDAFEQLPANIFAGYAVQLEAYRAFLNAGNLPSAFAAGDAAQLQGFIAELQAAGALQRFLGDDAAFFAAFSAFVQGGGAFDAFAGLNANIFAGYATQLQAYFDFLERGGVPTAYEPLSQDVIAQYLAELDAAGAKERFLPELFDFYAAYFAFVSDGGNPDNFAGLPVPPDFAAFAAALNAYADFLAAGNLPSEFDGEDFSVLASFIEALGDAGELEARLGDNAALLADYFAFLAGGGAPDAFAQLPVFTQYVADLNAYFAFLAAGGLPSEYTVLDQATLNAYLDLLANAQGGLSGFAALDDFFIDFFAFISGGGIPDDFAALPVNANRPQTELAGLNAFVFDGGTLRQGSGSDALIDLDGRITSVTISENRTNPITFDYSTRGADLREFGRIGNDVAWTRYFEGRVGSNPSFSTNLLAGNPATNLPTTGTIDYKLVGGTAPTLASAANETEALFTGDLAIAFGATFARVGLNFDVLTATEGYTVQTAGGAAGAAEGGLFVSNDGNMRFEALSLGATGLTGTSCNGFCDAQVFGGLFGESASSAGFTWSIIDRGVGNSLQGIAIFGAEGDELANLGSQPAAAEPTVPIGTGTPLILANSTDFVPTGEIKFNAATPTGGRTGFTADTVVFNDNQGVTDLDDNFAPLRIGTASVTDISTNERFAIGRWTDGEYISEGPGTIDTALTTAQGLHYLVASGIGDSFQLPTMGQITYDLIAASAPTISDSSFAPGRFEADMALVFGAMPRVAIEGMITMPTDSDDLVYSFASQGGIANPEQSETELRVTFVRNINFILRDGLVSASDNSCGVECSIQFNGYFAGDDALELGLTYQLSTAAIDQRISGAAIFGNGVLDDGSSAGGGDTGAPPSFVYAGGFPIDDARMVFSGGATGASNFIQQFIGSLDVTTAALDSSGKLTAFEGTNPPAYDIGTASVADIAGNEDVLIGRWSDGAIDVGSTSGLLLSPLQGLHYALARNVPDSFVFPNDLRVDYEIVASTATTSQNGSQALGSIDAMMAILFGLGDFGNLEFEVGFDGAITMPRDGGAEIWDFTTPGGLANEAGFITTTSIQPANATFEVLAPATVTNGSCTENCSVEFINTVAGDDGVNLLTSTYRTFGNSRGTNLNGSLIWQNDAIGTSDGGSSGGGSGGAGPTLVYDGGFITSPVAFSVLSAFAFDPPSPTSSPGVLDRTERRSNDFSVTISEVGALASIDFADFSPYTRGTANNVEINGYDNALIGRWTDGTWIFRAGDAADPTQLTLTENMGFHYLVTRGVVDIFDFPAQGRVEYDLLAATSPTLTNGSQAPGTLTAQMAIIFGNQARIAMEGEIAFDNFTYSFASAGGFAGEGQNLFITNAGDFRGVFNGSSDDGRTGAITFDAFFTEEDASRLGTTYSARIAASDGSNRSDIQGAAIFGTAASGASGFAPWANPASIAPSAAPIASIDMNRWGGAGSATPQTAAMGGVVRDGAGTAGLADLLPPGATRPERVSQSPLVNREAAIRQVERIMGGAITFGRPGAALDIE